jgi:Polyketide cyclase / dehydrase and lipid transport
VQTIVSRWGEHGERPDTLPDNDTLFGSFRASASIDVACLPVTAWELVTNIERIGEFSPECVRAEWIDGASGLEVGARFEGTNHLITTYREQDIDFTWIRVCTVTAAERPNRFAYTVGDRYDGTPACSWEFQIDGTEAGCRISQRFQHLPQGMSGTRLAADSFPADAEQTVRDRQQSLTNDMNETLQRIRRVLEANATAP